MNDKVNGYFGTRKNGLFGSNETPEMLILKYQKNFLI